MIDLLKQTPDAICSGLAARERARRREQKISQSELAARSGVSLGSLKRFEQTGQISLESLVKLAGALGYSGDFSALFERKAYASIEEVIADAEANRRKGQH